jgi:hypothetical protein
MVESFREKIEKCSKNIEIKSKKYSIKSIKRNLVGLYLEGPAIKLIIKQR